MAFDANKYKVIFEQRYGSGSFEKGLSQAREIGRLKVQADVAKSDYKGRGGWNGGQQPQQLASAYQQYQREKARLSSPTPRLDSYYNNAMKNVSREAPYLNSYLNPNVRKLLPPLAPANNKNLTPWEQIQLLGR